MSAVPNVAPAMSAIISVSVSDVDAWCVGSRNCAISHNTPMIRVIDIARVNVFRSGVLYLKRRNSIVKTLINNPPKKCRVRSNHHRCP